MGGANSTINFSKLRRPSKITSGKELVASTKEVREMANSLFRFMYDEFGEKEIMDMATEPEKYVIALSDLITAKFEVLGYITKQNQVGEIYFSTYDDLNPRISKPEIINSEKVRLQENQRQYAMIIAFYYVRLFQILGSLLIVIKDLKWEIPGRPGDVALNIAARQAPAYAGRPILQQGTVLPRWQSAQQGGAISEPALGAYEFLRYYLEPKNTTDIFNKYYPKPDNANAILFKITPNLYFEFDPTTKQTGITSADDKNTGKFILLVKAPGSGNLELAKFEIKITSISNTVPFITPKDLTSGSQISNFFPLTERVEIKNRGQTKTFDIEFFLERASIQSQEISQVSKGAKYTVKDLKNGGYITIVSALLEKNRSGVKNLAKILERSLLVYYNSITNTNYEFGVTERERENIPISQRKIGQLKESLKNPLLDEPYKLMKKGTQVKEGEQLEAFQPHCISRALQLLDSKSIQDLLPTDAKTSVCKFSIGDKVGSLTLGQYVPTKTLSQLYGKVNPADFKKSEVVLRAFVQTTTSSPSGLLSVAQLKTADQKEEADDLQSAIDRLNKAFNYLQDTLPVVDGILSIPVPKPKACKTSEGDINVGSQPTALEMQGYAQQMLAFHVNQSTEISKFLESIFDIKKDSATGRWIAKGPKQEYMFAGFPVMDQLTKQARELLVDYYSGCETLYQKGVKSWSESQPKSTGANRPAGLNAAAPAAPAAPVAP
jgi:hypothetical protein